MYSDLDKVQFIIENREYLSKTELAKRTGLNRTTVYRILKKEDERNGVQSDAIATMQPIKPASRNGVASKGYLMTSGNIASRVEIASCLTDQARVELSLYRKALQRAESENDKSSMVEALAHLKILVSMLETLGRWQGMDRNGFEDPGEIMHRTADDLTVDELNALIFTLKQMHRGRAHIMR